MKFNWGTGIALFYGTFALAMVFMVIKSSQHDVGLIKKNYYDDDINYQSHFDKLQNSKNLKTDLAIDLTGEGAELSLKFPAETPSPTGKVTFFRPSKTNIDKTLDIQVNDKNDMVVPVSVLQSGLWKVQVDWQAQGKTFYKEQNVFIEKLK
jgi:nitrogen fixation protein FixH